LLDVLPDGFGPPGHLGIVLPDRHGEGRRQDQPAQVPVLLGTCLPDGVELPAGGVDRGEGDVELGGEAGASRGVRTFPIPPRMIGIGRCTGLGRAGEPVSR